MSEEKKIEGAAEVAPTAAPAATAKKEPGMAMLVIVLAAISIVMALLLGFVNDATAPYIEANTQAKIELALGVVLPADEYIEVPYTGDDTGVSAVYEAGDAGIVVRVVPTSGFSGAIDMMVGITADGAISGISIITHAETSGLGANATDPVWQSQFIGLTDDVSVTKDGGVITSITGSTITSRAVCDGVNMARAVAALMY